MIISLLHNHYDAEKLESVKVEMITLGAPVIRVYDLGFENRYQAIEGSHRLRACEDLEICPVIEIVESDSLIETLDLDVDYIDDQKVDTLGDWENDSIEIDGDEIMV